MKRDGHAIAERDRTRFVEQQHVHVTRRFDCSSAHCQHIALKEAVHASDANGAEQSADRCRNQTDEQRDQAPASKSRRRINAEWLQRHADQKEDERQRGKKDRQRDLVRRFLAFGAFNHGNHSVEKTVRLFRRDADDDAVAQDARARP